MCRFDGELTTKNRHPLVEMFNKNPSMLVLLLSTQAGGFGINLASANKVIQYDFNWNPSTDRQAQDRAYRLGQQREVEVYRLLTQGTIEEMMYMRQLYKNMMRSAALGGTCVDETTRFEGVEGDSDCKGELFGMFNLFQYSEVSILKGLQAKYALPQDESVGLLVGEPVAMSGAEGFRVIRCAVEGHTVIPTQEPLCITVGDDSRLFKLKTTRSALILHRKDTLQAAEPEKQINIKECVHRDDETNRKVKISSKDPNETVVTRRILPVNITADGSSSSATTSTVQLMRPTYL
jgi:hypothetical protein